MNEYSGVTGDQKDVDSLQVTPTEMADAGDVTPHRWNIYCSTNSDCSCFF